MHQQLRKVFATDRRDGVQIRVTSFMNVPKLKKSLYLYSLVGVAHHSNEKIDENNCSDKKIESKNNFEEFQGPIINSVGHL